ncbi:MAG: hypothetical protein MJ235_00825 [archaeon]|nr:hypothetical protein [archaeon]
MKDDDFDDDTSDSDDLDKEDLKYAVLFDDGSHKLLFYGNDLAVLKKMANSVKFK